MTAEQHITQDNMAVETISRERKTGSGLETKRAYPGSPLFDRARQVENGFFADEGYTSGEVSTGMKEYEEYDRDSVFNVVTIDDQIVGVLREIWAPPELDRWPADAPKTGFKTLDDFFPSDDEQWDPWIDRVIEWAPNEIIEIGTVAVAPAYRHQEFSVSLRLYHMMQTHAKANGIKHLIASLDDRVLYGNPEGENRGDGGGYKGLFNFEIMGASRDYMGSPTTPVYLDFTAVEEYVKERHPYVYETGVLGKFD